VSKKDLRVTLLGDDKTGKAFGSAGKNAGKMVKALAAAGAAAGVAMGAFVAKGVKDAVQLETSLREVNSLFGLSGKAGAASFKELQKGVAGVSKEVGIAQDTLTKGLYTAISAGVPKENAFTFLQDAAKLGIAGVADTETAVNALTGVMNAFQQDNLSSAQAADLLFTTVRQGKTTLAELAPAIGTVGPAAAAAGVSFKDTAAALASVTKIIPNTSTAAAALRQVFAESDKTGTKFNDSLRTLGAETMGEAITKFGSFQGVLQAVYEQSGSNDVAFKNLFGSVEAGGAALTMVGTNAATAAADLAAMSGSAGNSELAFEEMNQSVARNMEKLKVTFQNLGIEVGNKVLPFINKSLDSLAAWWAKNGPAISATIGRMKDSSVASFKIIDDKIRATVSFFREHDKAAKALGVVVAGVMAAVSAAWAAQAAVATINAAKSVKAWMVKATASTTSATIQSKSTAQIVVGWTVMAAKAAANAAKVVAGWVLMGAQSLIQAARMAAAWLIAMGPIGWAIAAVVGITAVVVKNWGAIRNATVAAWGAVTRAVSAAWGAIKGAVSVGVGAVVAVVTAVPRRILGALGNMGGLLVNAGRQLMSGLARGIGERIAAVVQKVRDAVSKIKNLLPGSPVKEGPLTSWNRGGAGKRLMGMLAGGIEDASDLPARAMARAVDFGDVAGMRVGGTGYINSRLGVQPSAVGPSRGDTHIHLHGQIERLNEERIVTLMHRAERLAGY
jgi:TP901 family phage tail tape measure protein